jgi:hypothetical protein
VIGGDTSQDRANSPRTASRQESGLQSRSGPFEVLTCDWNGALVRMVAQPIGAFEISGRRKVSQQRTRLRMDGRRSRLARGHQPPARKTSATCPSGLPRCWSSALNTSRRSTNPENSRRRHPRGLLWRVERHGYGDELLASDGVTCRIAYDTPLRHLGRHSGPRRGLVREYLESAQRLDNTPRDRQIRADLQQ